MLVTFLAEQVQGKRTGIGIVCRVPLFTDAKQFCGHLREEIFTDLRPGTRVRMDRAPQTREMFIFPGRELLHEPVHFLPMIEWPHATEVVSDMVVQAVYEYHAGVMLPGPAVGEVFTHSVRERSRAPHLIL